SGTAPRRALLVGGGGHVLPRPRRQETADQERDVEPWALVVGRRRRPGPGGPSARSPPRRRHVEWLGHPHPVSPTSRLQPVLLSAGPGLAPRQRHPPSRLPALRPPPVGGLGRPLHLRRR